MLNLLIVHYCGHGFRWKVAEFGELVGVSPSTLRRWEREEKLIPERTLGNQRIYTSDHLRMARSLKTGKSPTRILVYCRVSSSGQKDDLLSQVKLVQDLLSIIHCFSSRLYGLRKYKAKVKKIVDGVDPCAK